MALLWGTAAPPGWSNELLCLSSFASSSFDCIILRTYSSHYLALHNTIVIFIYHVWVLYRPAIYTLLVVYTGWACSLFLKKAVVIIYVLQSRSQNYLVDITFFFLLLQHISLKLTECLEGPQIELGSLVWWHYSEQYSNFSFLHADPILPALKKLLVSTSGDHEFEKGYMWHQCLPCDCFFLESFE